jgi:hypothetical protein
LDSDGWTGPLDFATVNAEELHNNFQMIQSSYELVSPALRELADTSWPGMTVAKMTFTHITINLDTGHSYRF